MGHQQTPATLAQPPLARPLSLPRARRPLNPALLPGESSPDMMAFTPRDFYMESEFTSPLTLVLHARLCPVNCTTVYQTNNAPLYSQRARLPPLMVDPYNA